MGVRAAMTAAASLATAAACASAGQLEARITRMVTDAIAHRGKK